MQNNVNKFSPLSVSCSIIVPLSCCNIVLPSKSVTSVCSMNVVAVLTADPLMIIVPLLSSSTAGTFFLSPLTIVPLSINSSSCARTPKKENLNLKLDFSLYCISHYFRVQLFSQFWTRCGNSRGVNFAILLILSLYK